MAKYDDKLIDSYINGEVHNEALAKFLEEDKIFMEQVLMKTHDVSYYDKCSKKVKTSTGFTRFLLKHFQITIF